MIPDENRLQGFFSAWRMKPLRKGPLETLWHNATWIDYKNNAKT